MADDLPEKLTSGEPARLFPVLAETSKEGRALSVLLASVANIDDLGRTLLSTVGQRVGVRARVRTFTEVVLENAPEGVSGRPDGMIIVETGRRSWSALIEAKVRRARLDSDQVQAYLRLARANGVDAVITISNDFTAVPHHHPIRVSRPPRGVDLFHWSWTSILTYAKVLLAAKEVEDREQLFLLDELVRFLDHPSTGVLRFDRMGGDWRSVVTSVVAGARLARTSDAVVDTVANWHQECRDLALKLTELVNANVVIRLPMAHRTDPRRRVVDDAATFCNTAALAVEFNVPAAASPIKVQADLRTRSIQVSMNLRAPGDRKSSRARTNWLLRQLAGSDAKDLHVRAIWPGLLGEPQRWTRWKSFVQTQMQSVPRTSPSLHERSKYCWCEMREDGFRAREHSSTNWKHRFYASTRRWGRGSSPGSQVRHVSSRRMNQFQRNQGLNLTTKPTPRRARSTSRKNSM